MKDNFASKGSSLIRKIGFSIFSLTILIFLFILSSSNYLLFHNIVEIFSIIVAFTLFTIVWISRKYIDNYYLVFIGIAYLFIGGLDLLHTLSYEGMNIFKDYDYYANQLWIATRYLESITLFIAFFLIGKKKANSYIIFLIFFIVTILIILSVFVFKNFPVCYVKGKGLTEFKKISEYIISFILVVDLILLCKKREEFDKKVYQMMFISIILTILSELAFTFYISNYGISNIIGHYFKLFSFYLIFRAIIYKGVETPYNILFRNLKLSEERYKLLIDISPFGVFVHKNGLISFANKKGAELLGLDNPVKLEGENIFNYLNLEIKNKNISETLLSTKIEATLKNLERKIINVEIISIKFDYHGKNFLMSIIVDITERKNLERLRRDVDHIIRHNLRTPLVSIIGYSDLLLEDELSKEIREDIKKINESGQKMINIINSSLDLLKMEEGRFQLQPKILNLVQILDNLKKELTTLIRIKSIEMEYSFNEKTLDWTSQIYLMGDKTHLSTLFENLIKNAIEASQKGDKVKVDIIEIDGLIEVNIHNNSIIPEEIRDKFFDKYVTYRKNKGTGIGTYNAYLIAQYHQGNISFTTSDDTGTTLTVVLPKEINLEEI